MATPFKMPQLGETVAEGTITRWLKKEGESVQADEPLVEVSTDKVDSEIPAPMAGTVSKILVQEGDTVAVGTVIAEIGVEGEQAPTDQTDAPIQGEPKKSEEETAAAKAPKDEPKADPPEKSAKAPAAAEPDETKKEPAEVKSAEDAPRRGILSPLVRKLATQRGIDLESVRGSGTGGRITKQDIMAASPGSPPAPGATETSAQEAPKGTAKPAAQTKEEPASQTPAPAAVPAAAGGAGEEVVQLSNMRKSIAEHMVGSLRETARAWNSVEVDMTNIARLRELAGPSFKAKQGYSLTWMPFLSKAVSQALLKFPSVNATWNGDGTITRKHYVNLGIAVALENGLIVPVLKGADGMNLVGLARGVRDLADRARSKKLSPDDVHGGTFTITNPGPFGSVLSVPIINKGQAGILAFDAVVKRPVVVTDEHGDDSIAIRHMVFLSMSWDHRVMDGAEAAQFLAELKTLLQEADFAGDLSGYLPE